VLNHDGLLKDRYSSNETSGYVTPILSATDNRVSEGGVATLSNLVAARIDVAIPVFATSDRCQQTIAIGLIR
jgi:hypothetical protein